MLAAARPVIVVDNARCREEAKCLRHFKGGKWAQHHMDVMGKELGFALGRYPLLRQGVADARIHCHACTLGFAGPTGDSAKCLGGRHSRSVQSAPVDHVTRERRAAFLATVRRKRPAGRATDTAAL